MENMDKENPGDSRPKDWYVIRLKMNPGDTIFAARRGIVTEVEDQSNLNDAGLASAGSENFIEIVHRDCSFGHYGILKRNSALIRPGQAVEAGQPIGLVGGDRYGRGAEARFSVYYNIEQKGDQKEDGTKEKVNWVYIPLQFWTERNGKGKLKNGATYISEHPLSLITQEAKKTEKRKLKTKGKSA
jgi:murein DD-endopeptidase MepM/ murein hydrolase activator NlpD